MYVCMYVFMYVCTYVWMYVCIMHVVCILLSQFPTAQTNVPQVPDFQCIKMTDVSNMFHVFKGLLLSKCATRICFTGCFIEGFRLHT